MGVAAGVVFDIKDRGVTWLKNRRCIIRVHWFRHVLPPKIKLGANVVVIGKLLSFDAGEKQILADAVLTTLRQREASRALCRLFDKSIIDPDTYLPPELRNEHD